MKMYSIPVGTQGKVLIQEPNADIKMSDWTTRKDLTFSETILDPVRLHNNRGAYDHSSVAVKLVSQGFALFGGEMGNDADAKHILAVPYDQVKVV